MIGWYEEESRAVVLTLVARMAFRLANDTRTDSITLLSASPGLPSISASGVADFVDRAPEFQALLRDGVLLLRDEHPEVDFILSG